MICCESTNWKAQEMIPLLDFILSREPQSKLITEEDAFEALKDKGWVGGISKQTEKLS